MGGAVLRHPEREQGLLARRLDRDEGVADEGDDRNEQQQRTHQPERHRGQTELDRRHRLDSQGELREDERRDRDVQQRHSVLHQPCPPRRALDLHHQAELLGVQRALLLLVLHVAVERLGQLVHRRHDALQSRRRRAHQRSGGQDEDRRRDHRGEDRDALEG